MSVESISASYRRVFSGEHGLAVVTDLLDWASYRVRNGYDADARWTERLLGRQDAVLYILEQLGVLDDPREVARALLGIPTPAPVERPEYAE